MTACGDPPVVSGDLSCERFRHISATQAQIDLITKFYDVLESWVDQIVAHNIEYDRDCLHADPRGKGK